MYPMLMAGVPCTQSSRCSFPGVLCTLSFTVPFLHLSRPSPDPNPSAVVFVDSPSLRLSLLSMSPLFSPRSFSTSISVLPIVVVTPPLLLFSSFWSLRFSVASIFLVSGCLSATVFGASSLFILCTVRCLLPHLSPSVVSTFDTLSISDPTRLSLSSSPVLSLSLHLAFSYIRCSAFAAYPAFVPASSALVLPSPRLYRLDLLCIIHGKLSCLSIFRALAICHCRRLAAPVTSSSSILQSLSRRSYLFISPVVVYPSLRCLFRSPSALSDIHFRFASASASIIFLSFFYYIAIYSHCYCPGLLFGSYVTS